MQKDIGEKTRTKQVNSILKPMSISEPITMKFSVI